MTIDKLKIEGGQITVDYSGLMESFRISTSDEAKPSLYTAAANVAVLARVALGIIVERAGFVAIYLSHGDNPGSRIVLSVPTLGEIPRRLRARRSTPRPRSTFRRGSSSKDIREMSTTRL